MSKFVQLLLYSNVLLIAKKKLISKRFIRHSSGNKCWNEGKKNSIDVLKNLNEGDLMFERSVTIRDQVVTTRVSTSCQQEFQVVNKLFLAA